MNWIPKSHRIQQELAIQTARDYFPSRVCLLAQVPVASVGDQLISIKCAGRQD